MSKFYDDAQKWQLYVRHRRGRTLTQLQDETSIACGHPQTHFWGVPQTPSLLLCDDSDADDANDAVLGISLYHIPDSASLASSASF